MKSTTKAIVLHLSKYSDHASLLHLYTQRYGRMTYIFYGTRHKINSCTEPLSMIEIEINNNIGRQFQTINSINLYKVNNNISTDIRKLSVAFFLAEIIYLTQRHPQADEHLFCFFEETINELNDTENPENLHLCFMLNYSSFLGIMPTIDEIGKKLSIYTGLLIDENEIEESFSVKETTQLIFLMNETGQLVSISRLERQTLLNKLCRYYEYHLNDFFIPKSLDILKEVFD